MGGIPEPVSSLAAALSRLPGIGPRSAERLALFLVQSKPETVAHLAESMVRARKETLECTNCGALTKSIPCPICDDHQRDGSVICLVERPLDIFSVEKSGSFKGKYHVLGGKISPLNGISAEDLNITALENRLTREPIREIILALGTDVEGDATSFYLAKRLATTQVKVTRIAHGLPAGSGLDFADEVTLSHALQGRRELST